MRVNRRAVLPTMLERQRGNIINISSYATLGGSPRSDRRSLHFGDQLTLLFAVRKPVRQPGDHPIHLRVFAVLHHFFRGLAGHILLGQGGCMPVVDRETEAQPLFLARKRAVPGRPVPHDDRPLRRLGRDGILDPLRGHDGQAVTLQFLCIFFEAECLDLLGQCEFTYGTSSL